MVYLKRNDFILFYMLFWGFVTSAYRTYYFGFIEFGETLLRVSHWGIPIIILMINFNQKKDNHVEHN